MSNKIRAGVYIDGSNIYHGGLKAGWQLDYKKVVHFIQRKYEIANINYYNAIGYARKQNGEYLKNKIGEYIFNQATLNFEKCLKQIGVRVISKPLKFIRGNESMASNKMDGDLMIDAILEESKWSTLILFSGDSDFEKLIKQMIVLQKSVQIFSFKSRISYELKQLSIESHLVDFTKLDDFKSSLSLMRKKRK